MIHSLCLSLGVWTFAMLVKRRYTGTGASVLCHLCNVLNFQLKPTE